MLATSNITLERILLHSRATSMFAPGIERTTPCCETGTPVTAKMRLHYRLVRSPVSWNQPCAESEYQEQMPIFLIVARQGERAGQRVPSDRQRYRTKKSKVQIRLNPGH